MSDVFDLVGRKVAVAVVDTAIALERFDEPFRSGGITALEELWFRLTGKHLDWEIVKAQVAGIGSTEPAPSTWPASVPPGESPNYPPPTIEDDVLTYAGFRWQRLPVPTVEPASSTEPPADLREYVDGIIGEATPPHLVNVSTSIKVIRSLATELGTKITAAIARAKADAVRPYERLIAIIRTSHDLGIYHEKEGRCEVCEILGVPRKPLEGR